MYVLIHLVPDQPKAEAGRKRVSAGLWCISLRLANIRVFKSSTILDTNRLLIRRRSPRAGFPGIYSIVNLKCHAKTSLFTCIYSCIFFSRGSTRKECLKRQFKQLENGHSLTCDSTSVNRMCN